MAAVVALVERATSEALLQPDWAANLEVADAANLSAGRCGTEVGCLAW